VAVNTGEVAEFADIDLQDFRLYVAQRELVLGEFADEGIHENAIGYRTSEYAALLFPDAVKGKS